MVKLHPRVAYAFVSAFLKVVVFLGGVIAAYRVNDVAGPILSYWVTVPFVCLAIYGAKAGAEALDAALRVRLGWLPD
jgi:hypothetical protein